MAIETPTYDPYLYQITHRGNPGDLRYYTSACRGKQSVLELGCGAGRLMLPLLEAGHEVTGVDLHEGMLETLKSALMEKPTLAQRASLHHTDLLTLSLDKQFDRILLPFNLLFCLLTEADIVACLAVAARHLKPGGSCLFDVYQISDEELGALYPPIEPPGKAPILLSMGPELGFGEEDRSVDEDEWEDFATLADEARQINIAERREWVPATRRLDAYYRYQIMEWNPAATREEIYTIPQVFLQAETLKRLCKEAGLMVTQAYGDFRGSPWSKESDHLVAWAMTS